MMNTIAKTKHHPASALYLLITIVLLAISCEQPPVLPEAYIEDVSDIYHGMEVPDPYRWLENWKDPAVRAWSDGQNAYARHYLDHLPAVDAIRERTRQIYSFNAPGYYSLSVRGDKIFAMKSRPPFNHPLLVVMSYPPDPDTETVILDLNRMTGGNVAIDWYVPSPDGKLVAVSLSRQGTEDGDLSIFDSETGEKVYEEIPRVNSGTAGGDLAWLADGSGFYYTRYPYPGERLPEDLNFFQEVWFHLLGTPREKDRLVIGEEFPRIVEIRLELDQSSGTLLVTTQYGDGGEFAHYLVEPNRRWKQITTYADQISEAHFGPNQSLILVSRKDAPRGKILQLPLADPDLKNARVVVPQQEGSIVTVFGGPSLVLPLQDYLVVTYQMGGPSEMQIFDYSGKTVVVPAILPLSNIHQLLARDEDTILYANSSYIQPKTWYLYQISTQTARSLPISDQAAVDFSDCEVVRDFAISRDGTRIPVNIIQLKTIKLDGKNPVLLYGYGGYGISQTPSFSALRRIWIEQGGVFAVANLRGGGEYGEEWHRAGMLTRKQNVFDDFAAAMTFMIEKGYTTPARLAINGGSNGGLLMGAMITQFPHLFRAVVSSVGIYDMIRVELSPNGVFNIPEFGTVQDPEQFAALYAYSPYHHVKDGAPYPATLFMTGENDPRVDPMQSRKMTARMQAATSASAPVLLRTSAGTGHGSGTPREERINEQVDKHAFLFHQLGVEYQPVESIK